MDEPCTATSVETYGSEALNKMLKKLKATSDPRRRYEYVLWLAKKLPRLSPDLYANAIKVKGCVSQVYILGELIEGHFESVTEMSFERELLKGLLAYSKQRENK